MTDERARRAGDIAVVMKRELVRAEKGVRDIVPMVEFYRGGRIVIAMFCVGDEENTETALPIGALMTGIIGLKADAVVVTADSFFTVLGPEADLDDVMETNLADDYATNPGSEVQHAITVTVAEPTVMTSRIVPYHYSESPFDVVFEEPTDLAADSPEVGGRLTEAIQRAFQNVDALEAAGDPLPSDEGVAQHLRDHYGHIALVFKEEK